MKKTAVVYDKWLETYGGGEVVACTIAQILRDQGYKTTLISGTKSSIKVIKNKLGIDLTGVKLKQIWNDEFQLRNFINGKDLFVNTSFMDYSRGTAKRNFYYTHFPTETHKGLRGLLLSKIILPAASLLIKPAEFIIKPELSISLNGHQMHLINSEMIIAFSELTAQKKHRLSFRLFFEDLSKSSLDGVSWKLLNGKVIRKKIKIDHHKNVVHFYLDIISNSNSIKLLLNNDLKTNTVFNKRIFVFDQRITSYYFPLRIRASVKNYVHERLRAGFYENIPNRLETYEKILANSRFTQTWIKRYWDRDASILYPPVSFVASSAEEILFEEKENWICSVGRFFTLGHGKKQEVLIQAFKEFYDRGHDDWELHLIGGVSKDSGTQMFLEKLKRDSEGYPVYFHFGIPREELKQILLKSKYYWHATGYQESEDDKPIKFEHFGIAAIEAISAGCIPFLYNGGGLPEIALELGFDDLLFNSITDLVNKCHHLSTHKYQVEWQEVFVKLKNLYSQESFANKLRIIDLESQILRDEQDFATKEELSHIFNTLPKLVTQLKTDESDLGFYRFIDLWQQHGFNLTPNHFYYPIPAISELKKDKLRHTFTLENINFNAKKQKDLLKKLAIYSSELSNLPSEKSKDNSTFYFGNGAFDGLDAIVYYSMIRYFKPKQILEVGSGWSTKLAAEAVKKTGNMNLSCIEPYPQGFLKKIEQVDRLYEKKVEDVEIGKFTSLRKNDVLFIDTSHVIKTGGDVNYLILDVLQQLHKGVIVHIHDIFIPYEYPKKWLINEQRFWTEQYLVYAFLLFNNKFDVLLSCFYQSKNNQKELKDLFGEVKTIYKGGSLWLQRK